MNTEDDEAPELEPDDMPESDESEVPDGVIPSETPPALPSTYVHRRRTGPRAETYALRQRMPDDGEPDATKGELAALELERPKTRGDCVDGIRPCPWASCKHHLYLDADDIGSIKFNFPHLQVWEMAESCSLDIADQGEHTLEQVGDKMNFTRERSRQVEFKARIGMIEGLKALGLEMPDPDTKKWR